MSMKRGVIDVDLDMTRLKAAETVIEAGHRVLEFYAAAFSDTPDRNNDIIDPKAFDEWLPEFYAKGQALKISFNHAAMLDQNDPTNVIGYAPADADHVWVDDYGLRVKAFLDVRSEKGKAVEYQVRRRPADRSVAGTRLSSRRTSGHAATASTCIKSRDARSGSGPGPEPGEPGGCAPVDEVRRHDHAGARAEPLPYMTVEEFRAVIQKSDPDPLDIQARHDALVDAGAVCKHDPLDAIVEEVQKSEEESPDMEAVKDRMRKLRLLETSLP